MADVAVEVPQELLDQLERSGLQRVDEPRRVRVALAIHLFTTDRISIGRAAELAGYPLIEFHDLLRELEIPTVIYDREEYERDQEAVDRLRARVDRDGSR